MHWLFVGFGFLGAVTAFFTGTLLALGRHRPQVRLLGSAFFFLFAAILGLFTSFLESRYQTMPHLAFVHLPLAMLTGPAVFLFLGRAAGEDIPLDPKLIMHLLPPLVVTALMGDIYALPGETKRRMLAFVEPLPEYKLPYLRAIFLFAYATPLIYFGLTIRYLRPFFARASQPFDFLRAMRNFLLICAGAILLMLTTLVWRDILALKIIALMLFSTAVIVAFLSLARNPQFPELLARDARRYKRLQNRIPNKQDEQLTRLTSLIGTEQLYLNENLRVANVANRLSLRSDQVSQLINDAHGVNFNRYINRLRVEEACRRLAQGEDGILRIAFSCGFNTKSAFNAAFRLEMGMTPRAYASSVQKKRTDS